jgi:hypothetical protein
MSTISVSNIETANGSEPLTLKTGNTSGPTIVVTTTANIIANGVLSLVSRLGANSSVGTAGQYLTSGGASANAYWTTVTVKGPVAVKETVFVANGTFTKDANLVSLMVYCVGAGGGGGGSNSAATGTGAKGGWGGGGGGVAVKVLANTEVGATSNVVVGIGGAGGANATVSTGVAGSNSSFANSTNGLITGVGGTAGSITASGAGGTAINGDINVPGGDGNAGSGSSGSFNQGIGGRGGDSALGFGQGANQLTGSATGVAGDLYGGGGGGSSSANSGTTSRAGGAGANGIVWVVEYYTT